jgi:cell wall-active antibiotic response 4TMS protein YvqF
MHLDRRLLGWGLFFILLGFVPLAVRAGIADEKLVDQWPQLWPLILIGWGIGLVLRSTQGAWIGGAITAITLGVMGGGLITTGFAGVSWFSGCGGGGATTAFETQHGTFTDSGRMSISFDCGTIGVATAEGSDWSVGGSDPTGHGPDVTTGGGQVELTSPHANGNVFDVGRGRSTWNVSLPKATSLDVGLTLNAGDGTVNLSGARLTAFNLTVNAGSMRVDLASAEAVPHDAVNATVNAGSATISLPSFDGVANLSLNAGNLTACVPTGTALRVRWNGTLASHDLDGLGLVKVDQSTWTTPSFDASQAHVELQVSANAGDFKLKIGGTCGA